jgi:hypothetical protein
MLKKAVKYAETLGWRVEMSNGHASGHLLCPFARREGCIAAVWSTPKNPENHARHIRRDVDACDHESSDDCESKE